MPQRVAVAVSGGWDSTALLHCTLRQARGHGLEVHALHVHHGLQPGADDWEGQVRRQCRRWGAVFHAARLAERPPRGASVEAWARRERYEALGEMARAAGCGLVLLAHHRRDQAETWLLQALRGGGAAGLSGMPSQATRRGLVWARPWLDQPREAIEAYVRRHRLRPVDDPSNGDPRYARNRLRLQVWPALQAAFADAEACLAAAAGQAQQAAALAAECAALDLPTLVADGALLVQPWLALPPARRRNALQAWLAALLPAGVPHSLVSRLLAELPAASSASWPAPGAQLQLYRGCLRPVAVAAAGPAEPQPLDLSRPGITPLPAWGGRLLVEPAEGAGAPAALLRQVVTAPRAGGERFRLAPQASARGLKKQFQSRGVPADVRAGPLLYTAAGQLVFVPGLGIEGSCQAAPGEPQLRVAWVADGAPPRTGRRQRAD